MKGFSFLVPGAIDQLTGGYLYARHVVAAVRARGLEVAVRELAGAFPLPDACARNECAAALAALPDGAVAVIDGLALAGFEPVMAREARRLLLVLMVHHPLADETGLAPETARGFAALEARLMPLAAGILCPSARTAAAMASYGVAPSRIAVAPPGTMKPAQPIVRRHPEGAMRLLSVATVTPRKGHLVLIAALTQLGPRPWRLDIVGSQTRDPATAAAVRSAIADFALGGRVRLLGERPQERLADAYEAADLFVLPSFHEGYGMAFAEAMAWGLPIVATKAGAVPETVPPEAGLLVAPGDADALAGALARLMDDAALYDRLAAGAAAAGTRLAGWGEAAARWLDGLWRIAG